MDSGREMSKAGRDLASKLRVNPLSQGGLGALKAGGSKLFIQVLPQWISAAGFFLDVLVVESQLYFDISIKIELHIYIYMTITTGRLLRRLNLKKKK